MPLSGALAIWSIGQRSVVVLASSFRAFLLQVFLHVFVSGNEEGRWQPENAVKCHKKIRNGVTVVLVFSRPEH